MSLRRLSLIRLCTCRLNAKCLDQFAGLQRVRGTRSTMLRLRLPSAQKLHKRFTHQSGCGCKTPYAAYPSAPKTGTLWLQRSATTAAGQADSFAVSDVPYSQQLRHLTDIHSWIAVCESHGPLFQGVDNFAAIRKLVEVGPLPGPGKSPGRPWAPSIGEGTLFRDGLFQFTCVVFLQLLRNPHAGMPVQLRQRISELADEIFQATTHQVGELDSNQQQVLVLELSQLGVVFINAEWHVCCPPVPVPLLNNLLDSLLQRLRTLRGGQVGVLLMSLQRLQLCDSDAYSFILQEIERQLTFAKGDNSWYRQPDHLGKLVRGVVTVFLVRCPTGILNAGLVSPAAAGATAK